MKTITIYELLGMVKEGKAPKKVLYDEQIYSYVDRNRPFAKYIREPFNAKMPYYLFTDVTSINDIVEILEEEKKIPEKLIEPIASEYTYDYAKKICHKINEIIDFLKQN